MANVVLDTDFLSSFLKIDQLDLVRRFFRTERLLVPIAVYREIAMTTLLPALASLDLIQIVDRRAGRCARSLGTDVVDIPAFLLAYRRSSAVTVEGIRALVDALQDKDHYGFSKAVLEQLGLAGYYFG